ncbi:MAG: helix-turn-helix domain-containing protein [Gemmatimonadaceae bacterium]
MNVVARLPPLLLSHLRIVLGREHHVITVDRWDALENEVRRSPVDLVVADPRAEGTVRLEELRKLIRDFPSLPIVIYTILAPDTLGATVELAKLGVRHVVLRNFDDEPRRFRDLLERQPAYAMSDAVLASLARPLGSVPAELARAVERLFRVPQQFKDVNDLATAAAMNRRSLDRWLDRAGLATARMLVLGARLLRAYFYMQDPGRSLDEVVERLGYGSPRLFARQVRAATGLTPTGLRQRVPPEQFVALLTARLGRRGERTNAVQ